MKKIICLFLSAILIFSLAGCAIKSDADATEESETTEVESYPFYQTDETTYEIKTKYVSLYFPTKWEDSCKVNISDEGAYTVSFSTETKTGDTPLFDIIFGESDANKLGTLTVDGEEITVYIESYTFDPDALSEEEYNNCCSMQEDVNVIISKMIENNGFQLS